MSIFIDLNSSFARVLDCSISVAHTPRVYYLAQQ